MGVKFKRDYGFHLNADADPDMINKLVDWRMRSPSINRQLGTKLSALTEGAFMQRQFTVELRVDYADPDKNEVMKKALQAAARHMYATAVLLSDSGMKPEIMLCSDDFFSGNEELKLIEDTIQQGLDETNLPDEAPVSDELLAAVRDSVGQ